MSFYSGKFGAITVGSFSAPLDNWTLEVKTETSDVTNFNSGGWQELLSSIFSASITASGPYSGASGVTQGAVVAFTLQVAPGLSVVVSCIVESLKLDTSVKDAVRVNYTANSTGSHTISV